MRMLGYISQPDVTCSTSARLPSSLRCWCRFDQSEHASVRLQHMNEWRTHDNHVTMSLVNDPPRVVGAKGGRCTHLSTTQSHFFGSQELFSPPFHWKPAHSFHRGIRFDSPQWFCACDCSHDGFFSQQQHVRCGSSGSDTRGAQLWRLPRLSWYWEEPVCAVNRPVNAGANYALTSPSHHAESSAWNSSSFNAIATLLLGVKKGLVCKEKLIILASLMLPKQEDKNVHLIPVVLYERFLQRWQLYEKQIDL